MIAKVTTPPKRLVLLIAIVAAIALLIYLLIPDRSTEKIVTIQDIDYPVCTMNIPSSDCGPIEVKAKLANGSAKNYTRKGYMNGKGREEFDNDYSLLESAYRKKDKLQITTNSKNEITSVQIVKNK